MLLGHKLCGDAMGKMIDHDQVEKSLKDQALLSSNSED
jgi:hypothetical protein